MTPNDPLRNLWQAPPPKPTEADDCPSGSTVLFVLAAIYGAGCFALGYTACVWGWL